VTFPRVAWCGVAVVALHNAEEALTIPSWLPPRLARLEAEFRIQPVAADTGRLYWGLVAATLIPMIWVALAFRTPPEALAVTRSSCCMESFLPTHSCPIFLEQCCLRTMSRELSRQVFLSFPSQSG
jgi:hypothetical protein